jgi:hypothetical protein
MCRRSPCHSCFLFLPNCNCVISGNLGSRIVVDEGSFGIFPCAHMEYCRADHRKSAGHPSAIVGAGVFHRWRVRPHYPGFQFVFDREPADHHCELLDFWVWARLRGRRLRLIAAITLEAHASTNEGNILGPHIWFSHQRCHGCQHKTHGNQEMRIVDVKSPTRVLRFDQSGNALCPVRVG